MRQIGSIALAVGMVILGLSFAIAKVERGRTLEGRKLFYDASLGTNGTSCAMCHADFDENRNPDGLIRVGHPLYNAAYRYGFWGEETRDNYKTVAHGAAVCVEHYMQNPDKLDAQQLEDLNAYILEISPQMKIRPLFPAPAAARVYDGFEAGDRRIGRKLFYRACHVCHPNGGSGIGPALNPNLPAGAYAKKIREGDGFAAVASGIDPNAYNPKSGEFMPFFGIDRLSDPDVRDIIAYIKSLRPKRQK